MISGIDILRAFKYKVIIKSPYNYSGTKSHLDAKFGFSKISGLSMGTSDIIEYREGNEGIWSRKLPGLHKFPNLIFEKGKGRDNGQWVMEEWRSCVSYYRPNANAIMPEGTSNIDFRRNIEISLYDRNGKIKIAWHIYQAWPIKVDYSDLDAQTSTFLIETVEVAFEGLEIKRY